MLAASEDLERVDAGTDDIFVLDVPGSMAHDDKRSLSRVFIVWLSLRMAIVKSVAKAVPGCAFFELLNFGTTGAAITVSLLGGAPGGVLAFGILGFFQSRSRSHSAATCPVKNQALENPKREE